MTQLKTYKRKTRKGYKPFKGKIVRSNRRYGASAYDAPINSPFPRNKYVTLTYSDMNSITVTSGVPALKQYRLNSMYDPDLTGAGHKPRYFNSYLGAVSGDAPYHKYRVFGALVTLRFYNQNTTAATIANCAMRGYPSASGGLPAGATADELRELPGTKVGLLTAMYSKPMCVLKKYYSIKRILGVKDLRDEDDASAVYNANPTNQAYLDFAVYPIDQATTANYVVEVTIKYYAQLYELNMPNTS